MHTRHPARATTILLSTSSLLLWHRLASAVQATGAVRGIDTAANNAQAIAQQIVIPGLLIGLVIYLAYALGFGRVGLGSVTARVVGATIVLVGGVAMILGFIGGGNVAQGVLMP
jgi:1,4-dihydroxy-2-naphthoate octaprenyltransferase